MRRAKTQFGPQNTRLSPKDVPTISLSFRIGVFLIAWVIVLWLLIGPFVPVLRFYFAISVIPFQLYWIYIMLWVCRWSTVGTYAIRRNFKQYLNDLREEEHGHRRPPAGYETPEVIHWVFLANYKESLDVMRASLNALAAQSIGPHRICVVLATEAAEAGVLEKAMILTREFPEFRKIVVNVHQLREGEYAGKAPNMSNVYRALCANALQVTQDERLLDLEDDLEIELEGWHESRDARANDNDAYAGFLDRGIVTLMDADSVFHPFYFYAVERSYHFSLHSSRDETIWQAPICNYMNLYRIPTFVRVMSVAVSLHEIASLTHPTKQKLPFSTYSLSAKLALKMGGWASDVLAEDWHCFARAWSATKGRVKVAPIFLPTSCYTVEADSWFASCKERFGQAVRHSWAAIESASLFSMYRDLPSGDRPPIQSLGFVLWKMFKLHFLGVLQTPLSFAAALVQFLLMWDSGYNIFVVPSAADGFFLPPENNVATWFVFAIVSILMSFLPVIGILSSLAQFRYERCLQKIYRTAYNWSDTRGIEARINGNEPRGHGSDDIAPLSSSRASDRRKPSQDSSSLLDDDALETSDSSLDDAESIVETEAWGSNYTKPTLVNNRVAEIPFDTHGANRSPPLRPQKIVNYCNKLLMPQSWTLVDRIKTILESLIVMPFSAFVYGFLPALKCHTMLPFKRYFKYNVAAKPEISGTV